MFTAPVIFCQKMLTSMKVLKSFTIFQFVHQYIPWRICFPAAGDTHSIMPVCLMDQQPSAPRLTVSRARLALPGERAQRRGRTRGRAREASAEHPAPTHTGAGTPAHSQLSPAGPCSRSLWKQRSKDEATTPSEKLTQAGCWAKKPGLPWPLHRGIRQSMAYPPITR